MPLIDNSLTLQQKRTIYLSAEHIRQDTQMSNEHNIDNGFFYSGPERRHANTPRRQHKDRRYRHRKEQLISDCRSNTARRQEDKEGFIEIADLYPEPDSHSTG